jgi:hypothetical protein
MLGPYPHGVGTLVSEAEVLLPYLGGVGARSVERPDQDGRS